MFAGNVGVRKLSTFERACNGQRLGRVARAERSVCWHDGHGAVHLLSTIRLQQRQQLLADDESGLVRAHVKFNPVTGVDAHVGVGGFQNLAVFLGDGEVPVDYGRP